MFEGRKVHVGTFPIGIDPEKFLDPLTKPSVQERIQLLIKMFQDLKIFLGMDRLGYIKGMPHKLHAFEMLLAKYPKFIREVFLIQAARAVTHGRGGALVVKKRSERNVWLHQREVQDHQVHADPFHQQGHGV